jgi:hypothetical protein
MKWAKPQYVQILLAAFPQYQAAKADNRENVVREARRAIKVAAKDNDFTAPSGLTEVSLLYIWLHTRWLINNSFRKLSTGSITIGRRRKMKKT